MCSKNVHSNCGQIVAKTIHNNVRKLYTSNCGRKWQHFVHSFVDEWKIHIYVELLWTICPQYLPEWGV